MQRNNTFLVISIILMLVCLAGCGYVAGNYPPPDPTAVPDSNKVLVIKGQKYRCLNRDGTWKCVRIGEALAEARRDINDPRHLDASHR